GLVRRRTASQLHARIDSHGVVNEALNSFLARAARGEFPAVRDHGEVRRLLTSMVLRALCGEVRRHRRAVRSPAREAPLDPAGAAALSPVLSEWLEHFQAVVRPVHEKAMDIVSLALEGYTNPEIQQRLGLSLRTVQKIEQEMRAA